MNSDLKAQLHDLTITGAKVHHRDLFITERYLAGMYEDIIMVALCNRADHYIFALWFYLSSFFFPRLISAVGCLPYFHTSEMCCTQRAENTECKKSPFWHLRTTFSGYILGTKACVNNRKKLVKQRYLLYISSQYGELRPTSG